MERSQRLAEGNIPRLLLSFAAPAIVGLVAQALYYNVDRIFIGWYYGPEGLGLAAMTVAFPFMQILMAFGMLIGFGGTALISIRLGQQKKQEAEQVLGNAAFMLVAAAVLITTVGLYRLDWFLRAFGASADVLPLARDYLGIIVEGCVFQLVGFGMNSMIRGEGNPKIAMLTMLIGVLVNTALAPIFIFGFHWGMKGAALATIAAQAISAAWVLAYFLSGKSHLHLHARNLRLRWSICSKLLAIGSAPFAMQVAASMVSSILNNQLFRYGGNTALEVIGVIMGVWFMCFMPIFGVSQGAQPIIGYNYGAERFDRVKKTLQTAVLAASCIAVSAFCVTMLFPAYVFALFGRSDAKILVMGVHAIRICTMMFPLLGFQVISAGYFQAVGKPAQAMLLTLSRQVLLLIPAVSILPRLFGLGLEGVWCSLPIADFISSLLTATWLLLELRQLHHRHVNTIAPELAAAAAE